MAVRVGVIGGSGLDNPELFEDTGTRNVDTPWGEPSSPLHTGALRESGVELVLLARHGVGHGIPPHRLNHRANIAALKEAGCTHIVATTACGSLREDLHPGDLVVPDQFIDFTMRRTSFFDAFENGDVRHPVAADPFSASTRAALLEAAKERGIEAKDGATLVSIAGPRFSTRAESRMYRAWGCDLVNMTVAPECSLALEAEIPYACVAMVTDYDCWDENRPALGIEEIFATMAKNVQRLLDLLTAALPKLA